MNVFSIINQKGGCGKTTTAVNFAHALSKKGGRTLLIDFDPQAHTTFSLGIKTTQGICELLEESSQTTTPSMESYLIQRDENFFVIPSTIGLSALEHKFGAREDKLLILYKLFSQNKFQFDYCIIDCPPNLGMLALNALFASTHVIVPMMTCDLSLKGLEILNEVFAMTSSLQPTPLSLYYLLTQYDRRFRYSLAFFEKARASLKAQLLSTIIRTNISLREASSLGKTIFEYKPHARGADDYSQLAHEVWNLTQDAGWARFFLKGDNLKNVYVIGDFNSWNKNERHKMKKVNIHTWAVTIPLKKGKYGYKFFVNEQWLNDPHNTLQEDDSFGGKNSIVYVR